MSTQQTVKFAIIKLKQGLISNAVFMHALCMKKNKVSETYFFPLNRENIDFI